MSNDNRRRRKKLRDQDPHCFFCGRYTRPVEEYLDDNGKMKQGDKPCMATLEHLDSRYDECRGWSFKWPEIERTVLACNECNARRERERTQEVPIEELRRRAGAFPQSEEPTDDPT